MVDKGYNLIDDHFEESSNETLENKAISNCKIFRNRYDLGEKKLHQRLNKST